MLHSTLRVVPIESCLLHERTDPQRVARISERLNHEQVLNNPPIVGTHPQLDQFMVVDGATRTTALSQLGVRHLIAQVVDYADPAIILEGWNHRVSNTTQAQLIGAIQTATSLSVEPCDQSTARAAEDALAYSMDASGQCTVFKAPDGVENRHTLLQSLFERYAQLGSIARTVEETIEAGSHDLLIVVPHYRKEELIALVRERQRVPAGITRHTVPERVLRMNIPLAFLHSSDSIEHKQAWLDSWLQERRSAQRIRYYQEPTVVFDD